MPYRDKSPVLHASIIDHAQSDPFASFSRLCVKVPQKLAGCPADSYHNKNRNVALCDYLARCFHREILRLDSKRGGTGKSGLDVLTPYPAGDLALPRQHELVAAINRLRTLEIADVF